MVHSTSQSSAIQHYRAESITDQKWIINAFKEEWRTQNIAMCTTNEIDFYFRFRIIAIISGSSL